VRMTTNDSSPAQGSASSQRPRAVFTCENLVDIALVMEKIEPGGPAGRKLAGLGPDLGDLLIVAVLEKLAQCYRELEQEFGAEEARQILRALDGRL